MLVKLIYSIFGRSLAWRIGRAIYQYARGDTQNHMAVNGEVSLLCAIVDSWATSSEIGGKFNVFDVGANIGDWAENAIVAVPPVKRESLVLHMFEPVPETRRILKDRISKIAGDVQCHFHEVALSSKSGTANIYAQGRAGTNSLNPDSDQEGVSSVTVPIKTLSEFAAALGVDKLHFVKCDTEGHDMEVIKGALAYLKEGRIDVFQFEYNHRWVYSRHYLKDVFDLITGLPYRLGKVQPGKIEFYPKWHPEMERFFEGNYVLVHLSAMNSVLFQEVRFGDSNTPEIIS